MTTDLYKGHNQSDGEGIVYSDMNDMVRFVTARMLDQMFENMIGDVSLTGGDPSFGSNRGANAPTHLAYALDGGSAALALGSANNKLKITAGVLMQKIANATGNEPTLIPYSFPGTDEVTIAAGSAANPRVDLVQMKLEWITTDSQTRSFKDATTGNVTSTTTNKKRSVQCTLSVKQGTPAASPQYPDPDAGYVAVAGVLVGTNYLTSTALSFGNDQAGAVAVVHDQRMPIHTRGIRLAPSGFVLNNEFTNWAYVGGGGAATSSATNQLFIRSAHPGDGCSRLLFVAGTKDAVAGFGATAFQVQAYSLSANLGSRTAMNNIATTSAASFFVPYYTLEAAHAPAAGPTVLPSTTNKIGVPVWSGGCRSAKSINSQLTAGAASETGFFANNVPNAANLNSFYTVWAN